MISLVYASSAIEYLGESALSAILEASSKHNETCDLTGILAYRDSRFIQVLEGSPEAIQETMHRIRNDSRHHHVNVLLEQTISERLFGLWSMAFPEVHELTEEGLRRYSSLIPERAYAQVEQQNVLQILYSFRSGFRVVSP